MVNVDGRWDWLLHNELKVVLISVAILLFGGHRIFFVLMSKYKDLEEISTWASDTK